MFRTISSHFARHISHRILSKPQGIGQTRSIFTKDFLGVSIFLQKKEITLRDLSDKRVDISSLRKDILRSFGIVDANDGDEHGVVPPQDSSAKVLLSDDVRKMIYTAKSTQDVEETRDILRKFVVGSPSDNIVMARKKGYLFKDFMALCYTVHALKAARSLWKDEEFMLKVGFVDPLTGNLGMNMPSIIDAYLDLLYEKKLYHEVLEEVEKLRTLVPDAPIYALVVGMMSCLRINTQESMQAALKIYSGPNSEKVMRFSKTAHPYAYLACLQGNYGLAFEALSFTSRKSLMRTSLLVHVLCKMKRVSEALDLLDGILRESEAEDRPQSRIKITFPLETVMTLTKATEATSDKALKVRLASVFSRLDKIASISDLSLMDAVTAEIDATRTMKYKREKNWQRLQKQKNLICDEEEVDVNDDDDHRYAL